MIGTTAGATPAEDRELFGRAKSDMKYVLVSGGVVSGTVVQMTAKGTAKGMAKSTAKGCSKERWYRWALRARTQFACLGSGGLGNPTNTPP